MKQVVNVLWTGGLDSTCRICELSLLDIVVQPYYLNDPQRDSVKHELKAIKTITDMIRKKPNVKCELRDVIVHNVNDLAPDPIIRAAWKVLHEKYKIGTQYDWLARFTKQNNLVVEMSLEHSPRGKATRTLTGEGELMIDEEMGAQIADYMINPAKSSSELITIYEHLRFPSTLWEMTKTDEVEEMKSNGMEDVMKKTWFCYTPVFGMPCGHCNPCRDALNEDMAWRVPKLGRVLGFCQHYTFHAARHIVRRIQKKY